MVMVLKAQYIKNKTFLLIKPSMPLYVITTIANYDFAVQKFVFINSKNFIFSILL